MQRGWGVVFGAPDLDFQYPRSDRRRCNPSGQSASGRPSSLSVSSVGSEAMQLRTSVHCQKVVHPSFSILGRIGGDATFPFFVSRRGKWNLSVSSVGSEAMQQLVGSEVYATGVSAFSILGRIGGDATS